MFFTLGTQPAYLTGFSDPLKCSLTFGGACLSLNTEEAVICESKIAPLSMPRGTAVFGDSAPEIETEKYNHTDIDLFIMG